MWIFDLIDAPGREGKRRELERDSFPIQKKLERKTSAKERDMEKCTIINSVISLHNRKYITMANSLSI